ncbi:phage minor head protein [Pseudomonas sp. CAN2814]|uniref:phage head morphogenesis protein n=1 Tax=Pseudomonas sp. CAN1 TaxID=3046726 RepID=UPI0026476D8E|nr:phage minor head protein [Pseudomonas sp. CAN1]MDN6856996.1 phage minor head protein [Pseudomonas sp. CAN1]
MATPTEADLRAIFGMQPAAAIEYLERKGFAITWNWHDVDAATHARAFTVARAARLDVLQDIRDALTENLQKGQTLQDFQRNLQPTLEAKGWWGRQIIVAPDGGAEVAQLGSPRRLATIYQTNAQSAYMAGRYAAAYEARETHPYWMYVAVMDSVTRPSHAALHGKVYRWDDPIWQHIMPPNGYNCRCRMVALSAEAVKRRGLTVESSQGKTHQVTVETGVDKRTGEIREQTVTALDTTDRSGRKIQFRPDAGFDGSPIQSHLMDQVLYDKAERTLGAEAAIAEVQDTLLDPVRLRAWEAFVDRAASPQGQTMSIGVLDPTDITYAVAQGAQLRAGVVATSDTAIRNSSLARELLANLPQRLAKPDLVLWERGSESLVYVVQAEGVVLAVRLRGEVYGPGQLENVGQLQEVTMESIQDGLATGRYRRIR